nr:flagellar hook-associated protein FlgK [Escherichia coli]
MTKNTRFSPEVRQRAVRMVLESQDEYDSQWAAICSIAPKIGCTPETLRVWVRQHERDTGGGDGGLTTAERQRLKELERENRELRRSNDILRQASAYFAKAEFDRLWKKLMPLLDKLREQYGVGPVCSEQHIAPSTYYHCQQQRHHPDKRSARCQRDDWLKREIQRVYDENHQVYGVRKVWRQLLREGIRARQVAEISTIGASGGSPNSAGNGVQVDSIRRVSNQYQVNQVWYAASDYGYYSTQQGYLTQLEAVLSDDNSSLSGGFDNFFAALNEATTSPDDSALREQVISEAGALSLRIDNTLDYIDSQSTEIISQQQAMVSQINTLTSGIASYNQQIAQAEANGDNASALYDARDQMVEELSGMMDVQVNIDDQGNYNVTLKNGQPLVSGQQSSTIALETAGCQALG